jgi:hypothetical protein
VSGTWTHRPPSSPISFPDDVDQEFGVVVTRDRQVIQFVVKYGRLGDLQRQAADAVIDE